VTAFSTELWHPFEPEILAETARNLDRSLEINIQPDPIQAIEKALSIAHQDDLIWITGSLYLIGNVRFYWHSLEKLLEDHGSI
jgi:folylpolyglutamate synthase/dihydropteroate synthase